MSFDRAFNFEVFRLRRIRAEILLILATAPGEQSSASALHAMMGEEAVQAGIDAIEEQMGWLAAEAYVSLTERADELVAAITDRGIDLVERRETNADVNFPRVRAR